MVYRFMGNTRTSTALGRRTCVFGVSSSAYYKWVKKKGASEGRDKRDAELIDLIGEIVERHHYR
jgi:hypothetical protein